jgi:hypothetical protein
VNGDYVAGLIETMVDVAQIVMRKHASPLNACRPMASRNIGAPQQNTGMTYFKPYNHPKMSLRLRQWNLDRDLNSSRFGLSLVGAFLHHQKSSESGFGSGAMCSLMTNFASSFR